MNYMNYNLLKYCKVSNQIITVVQYTTLDGSEFHHLEFGS